MNLETLFMNLLVVADTYIYKNVGNCLVVKNGGRHHVLLAHMEHLGEAGWNRRLVDFQMWNWYYLPHACKLANTPMKLPPCAMYLLILDEFHWVAASDGRAFIDCIQFLWGLHQNCRGQHCWGRMMIDRHEDESKSILFALDPLYVHKKLFFITGVYLSTLWSLVAIITFSGWNDRPRPYSQALGTSRNSEVSHSTTASTHRIPLDMCTEAGLWECYWVRDYLLSCRPWLFMEVDDRRDLR